MPKNIANIMTSNSDDWRTPSSLYKLIVKEYGYKDLFEYCSTYDQYEILYSNDRLYMNPPYSHINKRFFKEYLSKLLSLGNDIILLIPSRTDTRFFHWCLQFCTNIHFFKGRLHFNDSIKSSTFPSCLLYLRKYDYFIDPVVSFCSLDSFVSSKGGVLFYGKSHN